MVIYILKCIDDRDRILPGFDVRLLLRFRITFPVSTEFHLIIRQASLIDISIDYIYNIGMDSARHVFFKNGLESLGLLHL